jgi:hypothetical protein
MPASNRICCRRTYVRGINRGSRRALQIADRTGARIIRVFSYWRTVEREVCFDRIVEALRAWLTRPRRTM